MKKLYVNLVGAVALAAMGMGFIILNQLGATGHLAESSGFVGLLAGYLTWPLAGMAFFGAGDLVFKAISIKKHLVREEKKKQAKLADQRKNFHDKMYILGL